MRAFLGNAAHHPGLRAAWLAPLAIEGAYNDNPYDSIISFCSQMQNNGLVHSMGWVTGQKTA